MFKKNKADLSESNRQCFLLTTQNASFLSEGFSNCSLCGVCRLLKLLVLIIWTLESSQQFNAIINSSNL